MQKGYQASTGSACSSKTLEASPVLKALNLDDVDVHGSLRISLGSQTHFDDVDGLVEAIKRVSSYFKENVSFMEF